MVERLGRYSRTHTPGLVILQYLQMLPQIAAGKGSTMWMIPSELTQALGVMASGFKAPEPAEHVPAPNGAVSPKSPAPER